MSLLIGSLAFAEIALAFAVGCVVAIILVRGPWRRLWVPAVPFASLHPLALHLGPAAATAPWRSRMSRPARHTCSTACATSLGSLLGLGAPAPSRRETEGSIGVARSWLRGRTRRLGTAVAPAPGAVDSVPLAATVTFWFLTAANGGLGRDAVASRYQYVGAVFLLLMVAEYGAGWRPGGGRVGGLSPRVPGRHGGNLRSFTIPTRRVHGDDGGRPRRTDGARDRADTVAPDFILTRDNSTSSISTSSTLARISPPSEVRLAGVQPGGARQAPEEARVAADKVLAAALPVAWFGRSPRFPPMGAGPYGPPAAPHPSLPFQAAESLSNAAQGVAPSFDCGDSPPPHSPSTPLDCAAQFASISRAIARHGRGSCR